MNLDLHHVVMFSGGIGSWAAGKRVVEMFGPKNVTLLFADVLMEDEDLYRFLAEAAADVGAPLVRIAEGRTPWQVFFDERFLGNSRHDPCSKILKRQMVDAWLEANRDPKNTVIHVGIDWSEEHRFDDGRGGGLRPRRLAHGWNYQAPMISAPFLTKLQMICRLADRGIQPPRLYDMGFSHNNCGGFCIKAGHGHFANLLAKLPERFLYHEQKEQEIREFLGKDVSMLTDRRGDGKKKPLTLRALRERLESQSSTQDELDEVGGCGCFLDD